MSKYTTEVRYICEVNSGLDESTDFNDVDNVINASYDKIFNFDFPIFDENYRQVLEKKILLHYYTREIGLETVGLWKLKLMTKMREIMPYYNQLYKSELLEFNPLMDVDLTTTHEGEKDDKRSGQDSTTSSGSNENSGEHWNKFSDTPQGALVNIENDEYLTSATQNITSGSSQRNDESVTEYGSNINTTEEYVQHIVGKNGGENYSKKLIDFRKTFLNIDMQVINELKDLFMYVW